MLVNKGGRALEEEVILNKIIEDANIKASKIIEDAKTKAREIEFKDQKQISIYTENQIEMIEKMIARSKDTEIEKAELESRLEILSKKQEQIKLVKEKVKQKIADLSVKEYCEIFKTIISKFPSKENLEIVVQNNKNDEISKSLKESGYNISKDLPDFNYGIIIRDGKVEYNYDFEEIMKFNNEKIEKSIANILFS